MEMLLKISTNESISRKIVEKHECSFCGMMRASQLHGTCIGCDKMLIRNERKFLAARSKRTPTRRCRDCKGVLPASRYFKCETCQPTQERETEDQYSERIVSSNDESESKETDKSEARIRELFEKFVNGAA